MHLHTRRRCRRRIHNNPAPLLRRTRSDRNNNARYRSDVDCMLSAIPILTMPVHIELITTLFKENR